MYTYKLIYTIKTVFGVKLEKKMAKILINLPTEKWCVKCSNLDIWINCGVHSVALIKKKVSLKS